MPNDDTVSRIILPNSSGAIPLYVFISGYRAAKPASIMGDSTMPNTKFSPFGIGMDNKGKFSGCPAARVNSMGALVKMVLMRSASGITLRYCSGRSVGSVLALFSISAVCHKLFWADTGCLFCATTVKVVSKHNHAKTPK